LTVPRRPPATGLSVICGRPDGQDEAIGPRITPVLDAVARFSDAVHFAGRFPNASIDEHLADRVVVIGEVAQLAAVVLRLLRTGRLGSPETGAPEHPVTVGFVALQPDDFTRRWGLAAGATAVETACTGTPAPIPLVRNDAGGVLVSRGVVEKPTAIAYVDDTLACNGPADRFVVRPGSNNGVEFTVEHDRPLRLPPKRQSFTGRAVSLGFAAPTVVISDGVPHPRPLPRWTWYTHTEPLLLAR
jgi:hypothetical protein